LFFNKNDFAKIYTVVFNQNHYTMTDQTFEASVSITNGNNPTLDTAGLYFVYNSDGNIIGKSKIYNGEDEFIVFNRHTKFISGPFFHVPGSYQFESKNPNILDPDWLAQYVVTISNEYKLSAAKTMSLSMPEIPSINMQRTNISNMYVWIRNIRNIEVTISNILDIFTRETETLGGEGSTQVNLGDIIELTLGSPVPEEWDQMEDKIDDREGFIDAGTESAFETNNDGGVFVVTCVGAKSKCAKFISHPFYHSDSAWTIKSIDDRVSTNFIGAWLLANNENISKHMSSASVLSEDSFKSIKINIPDPNTVEFLEQFANMMVTRYEDIEEYKKPIVSRYHELFPYINLRTIPFDHIGNGIVDQLGRKTRASSSSAPQMATTEVVNAGSPSTKPKSSSKQTENPNDMSTWSLGSLREKAKELGITPAKSKVDTIARIVEAMKGSSGAVSIPAPSSVGSSSTHVPGVHQVGVYQPVNGITPTPTLVSASVGKAKADKGPVTIPEGTPSMQWKACELSEACKSRGLKSSGVKKDLLARLTGVAE
jgi:hypothetical protein